MPHPNILTVAVKWPKGMKALPLLSDTASNFTLGKATVKDGCAHIELTTQEAKALEEGYYLHFDADGRFLTVHAEQPKAPPTSQLPQKNMFIYDPGVLALVIGSMFLGAALYGVWGMLVGLLVVLVAWRIYK